MEMEKAQIEGASIFLPQKTKDCRDLPEICSPLPCIAGKGISISLWTRSEGHDSHLSFISSKGKIQARLKSRERNGFMC